MRPFIHLFFPKKEMLRITLGGMLSLLVSMGLGRFALTPLIVPMMDTYHFGEGAAGLMASWNYIGYLAGAYGIRFVSPQARKVWVSLALVVSAVTTGLMGVESGITLWMVNRTIAGLASGIVLVGASAMVLEHLALNNAGKDAPEHYAGVGIGIFLSGLLGVLPFTVANLWFIAGGISLVAAVASLIMLSKAETGSKKGAIVTTGSTLMWTALCIAYFLEGAGYSVAATFLVDMADGSPYVWPLTGVTAAFSCFFWPFVAGRIGYAKALALALFVQAAGMPLVFLGTVGAVISAFSFGGTFLGSVLLALSFGFRMRGGKAASTLTVLFGIGQILAPGIAGNIAEATGSYGLPVAVMAVCVLVGSATLLFAQNKEI